MKKIVMTDKLSAEIVGRMIRINSDRHLGNFGFVRNVDTGEFVGPAPLFDFGSAFFPDMANTKKETT